MELILLRRRTAFPSGSESYRFTCRTARLVACSENSHRERLRLRDGIDLIDNLPAGIPDIDANLISIRIHRYPVEDVTGCIIAQDDPGAVGANNMELVATGCPTAFCTSRQSNCFSRAVACPGPVRKTASSRSMSYS